MKIKDVISLLLEQNQEAEFIVTGKYLECDNEFELHAVEAGEVDKFYKPFMQDKNAAVVFMHTSIGTN